MERISKIRSRREMFRAAIAGVTGMGAGQATAHAATQGAAKDAEKDAASSWTPKKQNVGGVIRSGHLLFMGGIGGWYPERRPEGPGDVRQQMADALEIMKTRLEGAGSSMANVLKVHVSLVDPNKNWDGMNEVFNRYFSAPRPVRSFAGVTLQRSLVQVDCIAYVD
jgi:enamine deaminase RidA (YjgF/YER057c/UK114 family)